MVETINTYLYSCSLKITLEISLAIIHFAIFFLSEKAHYKFIPVPAFEFNGEKSGVTESKWKP